MLLECIDSYSVNGQCDNCNDWMGTQKAGFTLPTPGTLHRGKILHLHATLWVLYPIFLLTKTWDVNVGEDISMSCDLWSNMSIIFTGLVNVTSVFYT